jgi:hypothetical protein
MSKHKARAAVSRSMRSITLSLNNRKERQALAYAERPALASCERPYSDTFRHIMQETRRSKHPFVLIARKWHRHKSEQEKLALLFMQYRYEKLRNGQTPKVFERWLYDNRKAYPYVTPHLREQTIEQLRAWRVRGV